MSSFLKSIFHSSNKHKKLCEEWTSNREPVVDGVTFYVRYLGSSLVEDPKSAQCTAAGVKRVIHAAKAGGRRPERVAFRVSMEGVRIDATATGETLMDTSIYKISYCSADSQYDQVLAFVASNDDDSCECHAFICSKRKVAEAIAVSIAQAFTMAYECWKLALEAKRNGQDKLTAEEVATRGGESPPSSKGMDSSSRASSPGHCSGYSSPPSEVSSTSGYHTSPTGGLLLELDYSDAGSSSRSRKQWTQFGSCDDLVPVGELYTSHSSDELRQFTATRVVGGNSSSSSSGENSLDNSPNGCSNSNSSVSTSDDTGVEGGESSSGSTSVSPRRFCALDNQFSHFNFGSYSHSDSEQQLLTSVN